MIESVEIDAPIERVWSLLREEAQLGVDASQADILSESRGRQLLLEVRLGAGFRVQHAYELRPHGSGCTASDTARPLGWRWRLSNVFLFGRGMRAIDASAEQGLRNLKAAAEDQSNA